MGTETKIEWCDHTFNPWWGCTRVSPACEHCYAEAFAKRTGNDVWGAKAPRKFFGDKHWAEPRRWNEAAAKAGVRKRVFCASMADVFEDRRDLDEARSRLWTLIAETPHLDWLLLTKRPDVMLRLWPWQPDAVPHNVWAGVTLEDQRRANERIPVLLRVPARVRFLSCEPLLGPVDLDDIESPDGDDFSALDRIDADQDSEAHGEEFHTVDWVIAGGESGPGARPMKPDWARALRDQCANAGVPFFLKQWGDWWPVQQWQYESGREKPKETELECLPNQECFIRLGKAKAGSLLDGREHKAWPEVAR